MKRYLIIGDYVRDELFQTNEVTRDDLVRLKKGSSDHIIDTVTGTYFDSDKNEWLPITQ